MGYIAHTPMIVIGFQEKAVREARAVARDIFDGVAPVSEILVSPVNDCFSFMVGPDGSKEGWLHSDEGDAARRRFAAWVSRARAESKWLDLIEVSLPEDQDPSARLIGREQELA